MAGVGQPALKTKMYLPSISDAGKYYEGNNREIYVKSDERRLNQRSQKRGHYGLAIKWIRNRSDASVFITYKSAKKELVEDLTRYLINLGVF